MADEKKYKVTKELMSDFASTIGEKPNLSSEEIFTKFPEFNGDNTFLQATMDYYETSKSGKYKTQEELNSKFPEFQFDVTQETTQAQPQTQLQKAVPALGQIGAPKVPEEVQSPFPKRKGEVATPPERLEAQGGLEYDFQQTGQVGKTPFPETVADARKKGKSPTFENYAASIVLGTGEHVGEFIEEGATGVQGGLHKASKGLKMMGVITPTPEETFDIVNEYPDNHALRGFAKTLSGVGHGGIALAMHATPSGILIGEGIKAGEAAIGKLSSPETAEKIGQWLFAPVTTIWQKATGEELSDTEGDVASVLDIAAFMGALGLAKKGQTKIKEKWDNGLKLTPEEANIAIKSSMEVLKDPDLIKQVEEVHNVKLRDAKGVEKKLEEMDKKLPENKVINVIENKKKGQVIIKDIVELDMERGAFEKTVTKGMEAGELTGAQAREMMNDFDSVLRAKAKTPEVFKKNPEVIDLMIEKERLEKLKKESDDSFHEFIEADIKKVKGEISSIVAKKPTTIEAPSKTAEGIVKKPSAKAQAKIDKLKGKKPIEAALDDVASEKVEKVPAKTKVEEPKVKEEEVSPMKEEVTPEGIEEVAEGAVETVDDGTFTKKGGKWFDEKNVELKDEGYVEFLEEELSGDVDAPPVEAVTPEAHRKNIETKLRDQFKAKGVAVEQVDGSIAILNARAKSWASEKKGRNPDEYFAKIADVKSGEFTEGAPKQFQLPNGEKVMGVPSSPEVVNGFYSPIEKQIIEAKQDKMPAKKWSERLSGEEAEFTGLKDWLKSKEGESLTKADVQKYLKENRIEVVEIVKGGEDFVPEIDMMFKHEGGEVVDYNAISKDSPKQQIPKDVAEIIDAFKAERLDEIELTNELDNLGYEIDINEEGVRVTEVQPDVNEPRHDTYQLPGKRENYKEVLITMPKEKERFVKAEHFEEPNIIAFVRMNTRKDANGNKVVFLEEIQSDWGQEGKRLGFKKGEISADAKDRAKDIIEDGKRLAAKEEKLAKEAEDERIKAVVERDMAENKIQHATQHLNKMREQRLKKKKDKTWTEENQAEHEKIQKELIAKAREWDAESVAANKKLLSAIKTVDNYKWSVARILENSEREAKELTTLKGVPDAPFIKKTSSWIKLALKNALRHAVQEGATKISWTTGEQQNARWSLSQKYKGVRVDKEGDGTYTIWGLQKNRTIYDIAAEDVPAEKLYSYIGKDLAKEVVERDSKDAPFLEKAKETKNALDSFEEKMDDKYHTDYTRFDGKFSDYELTKIERDEHEKLLKNKEEAQELASGKEEGAEFKGTDLEVGGSAMKAFYGTPKEGNLGTVGEVAKKMFKQEPKTVEIEGAQTRRDVTWEEIQEKGEKARSIEEINKINAKNESGEFNDYYTIKNGEPVTLDMASLKKEFEQGKSIYVFDGRRQLDEGRTTQHSIDITPEMKAEVEQGQPLFQKGAEGKPKGAVETLADGRKIIHALDAPDFSTMVHEVAHLFEDDLTKAEAKSVKDFGGSEPFARGFERYLRDGFAPTPKLKALFEKFKQWLTDIYSNLKGTPIEKKVTPEIKAIFDRMLTERGEVAPKVAPKAEAPAAAPVVASKGTPKEETKRLDKKRMVTKEAKRIIAERVKEQRTGKPAAIGNITKKRRLDNKEAIDAEIKRIESSGEGVATPLEEVVPTEDRITQKGEEEVLAKEITEEPIPEKPAEVSVEDVGEEPQVKDKREYTIAHEADVLRKGAREEKSQARADIMTYISAEVGAKRMTPEEGMEAMAKWETAAEEAFPTEQVGKKAEDTAITYEAVRELKAEATGKPLKRRSRDDRFAEINRKDIDAKKDELRGEVNAKTKLSDYSKRVEKAEKVVEESVEDALDDVGEPKTKFVKTTKETSKGKESPIVQEAIEKALGGGKSSLTEVVEANKEIIGEISTAGKDNAKFVLKQLADKGLITKERWVQYARVAGNNITKAIEKRQKHSLKESERIDREIDELEKKAAIQAAKDEAASDIPYAERFEASKFTKEEIKNANNVDRDLNVKFYPWQGIIVNRANGMKLWNASMDVAINSIKAGKKVSEAIKEALDYLRGTEIYKTLTLKNKSFAEKSIAHQLETEAKNALKGIMDAAAEAKTREKLEKGSEKAIPETTKDAAVLAEARITGEEGVKFEGTIKEQIDAVKKLAGDKLTEIFIPRRLLELSKLTKEQRQEQLESLAVKLWDMKEKWFEAIKKETGKTEEEFMAERDTWDLDMDEMQRLSFTPEYKDIFSMKTKLNEMMEDFTHLNELVNPTQKGLTAQMNVLKFTEAVKNGLFPDLGMDVMRNGASLKKEVSAVLDAAADLVNKAIDAGLKGEEIVKKVIEELKGHPMYKKMAGRKKFDKEAFDKSIEDMVKGNADIELREVVKDLKEEGFSAKEIAKELEMPLEKVEPFFTDKAEPPPTTPPPTTPVAPKPAGAPKPPVEEMFEQQRKDAEEHKADSKTFIDKVSKAMIDRSGRVKDALIKAHPELGKKAVMMFELMAGATAKTAQTFGKVVDNMYGTLRKKGGVMSMAKQRLLADYIQAKRTIEIDRLSDEKGIDRPESPKRIHKEELEEWINRLEAQDPVLLEKYGLDSFDVKELENKTSIYTAAMKSALKDKLDAGLISKEAYNELVGLMYSPRLFIQHLDPVSTHIAPSGRVTVSSSGIKELGKGDEKSLINNPQLLLMQVIARTDAAIAKNKANQALADVVKANPENGFAEMGKLDPDYVKKSVELAEKKPFVTPEEYKKLSKELGSPRYVDAPLKHIPIDYMENGVKKRINVLAEYAEDWLDKDPQVTEKVGRWITHLSGSSVLKSLATTFNPEFAVSNFFRDAFHIFLTTEEFSAFGPKMTAQFLKDMQEVSKDVVMRRGVVEDYVNEGGGMDMLSQEAMPKPKIGTHTKLSQAREALWDALGYVGTTSELMTRMALRNRSIKNQVKALEEAGVPITPEMMKEVQLKATHVARSYLDFSQGGDFAKTLDKGLPYFNAGIQGSRGVFRAAKRNPKIFWTKVAELGALSAAVTAYNLLDDDRARAYNDDVPDSEKAANFIIMTDIKQTSEDGTVKHLYLKIPKDQGQQLIAGLFEDLYQNTTQGSDKKILSKRRMEELSHLLSAVPAVGQLPPTIKAGVEYSLNKSIFTGEDIWKGAKVNPELEKDTRTPIPFVKFGEATKDIPFLPSSPKKIEQAVGAIIPRSAAIPNMLGSIVNVSMNGLSPEEKNAQAKTTIEKMSKTPFLRKMVGISKSRAKKERIQDVAVEIASEKEENNFALAEKMLEVKSGKATQESVEKWIRDTFQEEKPKESIRLFKRMRDRKTGVPVWYLQVKGQDSETAARAWHEEWEKSSEKERETMMANGRKAKLFGPAFNTEWGKLKQATRKNKELISNE